MTNALTMPTVTLADGTVMPQIGLGVFQADSDGETEQAVTTALEAGYRLIDTAAMYGNEADVGKAIAASNLARGDIFVTTKLWNTDQGAENVRPALEDSLRKLGLDYVDLYLIHWPTPARDLYVDTWKMLRMLKQEGLIKSIGVSNFNPEHLDRLLEETGELPVVDQVELHPYMQQQTVRSYAEEHHIQIESWGPIGGSGGSLLEDETIGKLAKAHDKSPAQIVIRWHLQHGFVVIPKSVHEQRIRENIDVFDFELSEDDMAAIDALDRGARHGPDPETMNRA